MKACIPQPRIAAALLAVAWLIGAIPVAARAENPMVNEQQVKAVFLFNFVQFVEWPESAFASSNAPICIGVLGDESFGKLLDEVVKDETIRGRKLMVKPLKKGDDVKCAHAIFVSKSARAQASDILADCEGKPVLTVGEAGGFARHGGVINFVLQNNKVKFEINPDAAKQKGLKISAQVLGIGKIVGPETSKENP